MFLVEIKYLSFCNNPDIIAQAKGKKIFDK